MATLSALLAGRLNGDQPEAQQQQQQQQHIAEPSLDPIGEAQTSAAILSTLLAGTLTYVDLGLSFPDPAAAAAALLSSSSSSSSSGCFAGCVFLLRKVTLCTVLAPNRLTALCRRVAAG
jgi:hypothetical protein